MHRHAAARPRPSARSIGHQPSSPAASVCVPSTGRRQSGQLVGEPCRRRSARRGPTATRARRPSVGVARRRRGRPTGRAACRGRWPPRARRAGQRQPERRVLDPRPPRVCSSASSVSKETGTTDASVVVTASDPDQDRLATVAGPGSPELAGAGPVVRPVGAARRRRRPPRGAAPSPTSALVGQRRRGRRGRARGGRRAPGTSTQDRTWSDDVGRSVVVEPTEHEVGELGLGGMASLGVEPVVHVVFTRRGIGA